MAQQVIDACPDAEWRLIFALSRYAGLRCHSEHLALRWLDVNWEKNRILIHAPKQEHHSNGGDRWIPIFPELHPCLEECFDLAEVGEEFVIVRYRDTNTNLRTQLMRIIKRAGVKPWPKLFHNLRASRETELAATYPLHTVCEWIGNSARIASAHYLQVTKADFERAAQGGAESGALVAQNQAQRASAHACTSQQESSEVLVSSGEMQGDANACKGKQKYLVRPEGVEPPTYGSEDHCSIQLSYGRNIGFYVASTIVKKTIYITDKPFDKSGAYVTDSVVKCTVRLRSEVAGEATPSHEVYQVTRAPTTQKPSAPEGLPTFLRLPQSGLAFENWHRANKVRKSFSRIAEHNSRIFFACEM